MIHLYSKPWIKTSLYGLIASKYLSPSHTITRHITINHQLKKPIFFLPLVRLNAAKHQQRSHENRLLFFIFFACSFQHLFAHNPQLEWAKQITSSSPQTKTRIMVDEARNSYTVGAFKGTADFDPGPGTFELSSWRGLLALAGSS